MTMQNNGTALYLEAFEYFDSKGTKGKLGGKSKEQFKDLNNNPGEKNKKPFIPKSGPESADGFKDKKVDAADGEENHFDPTKKEEGDKKTVKESLNISSNSKNMSDNKNTPVKSEFDRLCEEVLGPEEVELGIDEVKGDEGAPAAEGENPLDGEECPNCTPADRIRNIITELEGILAELEGTSPEGELEDGAPEGGEGTPEGDGSLESPEAGAPTEGALKEGVEAEEIGTPITGMKKGKPDATKGRANVVEGEASKTTKGPGDGKIQGNRNGNIEKATDGKAGLQGKNNKVGGKVTGGNQPMFK